MRTPPGSTELPAPVTFAWRSVVRDVPRAVWAVTALHVAVLLAWSLLLPPFDAPDEPQHFDMVIAAFDEGLAWPAPDGRFYGPGWLDALVAVRFTTADTPAFDRADDVVAPKQATPRGQRARWADLVAAGNPTRSFRNQMTQHPPLYYRFARTVLAAVPGWGSWRVDALIGALRLLSVALLAGLPLLVHALARTVTGDRATALTAAILPLTVPMLGHTGSVISNDALLTVLFAVALLILAHVAKGDTSVRTAAWVGGVTTAALMTKGFGLVVPVLVVGAYGLAAVRRGIRSTAAPLALALAGSAVGLAWYAQNLVLYGVVQPTIFVVEPAGPEFKPDGWWFLKHFRWGIITRFWGSFGWAEADIPRYLALAATWVTAALVATGLVLRRARDRIARAELVGLLLPTLLLLGLVVYGAWDRYQFAGELRGIQGRYLLHGVAGLAVLVAVGAASVLRSWRAVLPVLALLAALGMQRIGAEAALGRFWAASPDLPGARLAAVVAWAPWPPGVTVGIGLLLAATVVWSLLAVGRSGPPFRRSQPVTEEPERGHSPDAALEVARA